MKLIVDRIEDGIAVCEKEDLSRINIAVSLLPNGAHEGSVIISDENGNYALDTDEEETRRKRMLELQNKIFKKNS